ncbi:putative transcription factor interactor and regulator CCHC(Zn) family [Helianthus annuus]|nr:putative transcription factor interactor and regulator CCHC(Zn) family [Helianthus annuus]
MRKETEPVKETEPIERSIEEIEENLLVSDSIDNTNCSNSCAESETVEEQSVVNDEPHSDVADNSDAVNHDLDVWNYVMSYFAEAYGVPTRTDESGAVILDRDENVFTRKPDVSTDKLDTCVSSDSESHSDGSDNYPSVPETSDDTSEPREQGSSDEPDSQVADFGTTENEHSTSENSECVKHSVSSSATPEEHQTVSNIDCSLHKKPESADVKDSEVDETEEKTFTECISKETHGSSKIEEKGSMEINSSVESNDETEEEIFMESFSVKTPENIVSKEKESVEVNSTENSTCDPKESNSAEIVSNEAKSSKLDPPKKKRSRKNRKQRKKKVQKENPSLTQTKSKLKGKVADAYSLADNREHGPSKIKHEQKQSAPKEKKRPAQFSRITQAELNVFFSKRQTCFNCGIPGHIARNCVHRPYHHGNMYHQKAMHSHFTKNGPPKARPSDRDWNLAKQENKKFSNINRFQRKTKVFPSNESVSDTRNWKPKTPVGSQSPCSQPSTSTSSPKTTDDVKS